MKHYRSFCFTPRENHNKIRLAVTSASIGVAVLLGGVLWAKELKAQTPQQATPAQALQKGDFAWEQSDFKDAMLYYLRAPDDARAEFRIASMYFTGGGTQRDEQKGMEWLLKSANQNYPEAEEGLCYIKMAKTEDQYKVQHDAVQHDKDETFAWCRKAAANGADGAQFSLGVLYERGIGTAQDPGQAFSLYQKAAQQGNAAADYRLALLYINGTGVAQDAAAGAKLMQEAAAKGNADAQTYLSKMDVAANDATSAAPSDEEILRLAKQQVKADAFEAIQQEYGDLDHMNGDILRQLNSMTAPAALRPILVCSMNAPADRQVCLDRVKAKLVAERAELIRRLQASSGDEVYVYTIEQKKNYEGNYVVYLKLRQRGTDTVTRWKLLLKPKNGSWVIANKEETEIK